MQSKNQKLDNQNFKQRSYHFTLGIMRLIEILPNKKSYWSLGDQLFRSASSVGANVTEATAASSRRDFIRSYEIALKSANETKYWLGLVKDSKCTESDLSEKLLQEAIELSKILGASILTLKNKR